MTTIVMISPKANDEDIRKSRWNALKRAFEKAGATVDVAPHPGYFYARDPFVLVDDCAFFPLPPGEERPANMLQNFQPHVEKYGYQLRGISSYGGVEYNGGNFIHDVNQRIVLVGQNPDYLGPLADNFHCAAIQISKPSINRLALIDISDMHIDCAMGLLPNGQLIVKLDETDKTKNMTHGHLISGRLMGVQPYGLKKLERLYGRENIITFAFGKHPEADIRLGMDILNYERPSTAWSMLTNFESVGNTIIGETFPRAFIKFITQRGMKTISAKAMGVPTFVMSDDVGPHGGARCTSLKVIP